MPFLTSPCCLCLHLWILFVFIVFTQVTFFYLTPPVSVGPSPLPSPTCSPSPKPDWPTAKGIKETSAFSPAEFQGIGPNVQCQSKISEILFFSRYNAFSLFPMIFLFLPKQVFVLLLTFWFYGSGAFSLVWTMLNTFLFEVIQCEETFHPAEWDKTSSHSFFQPYFFKAFYYHWGNT